MDSVFFSVSYQKSRHFEQVGYEEDFNRFLQTLVADVEKRIRRGHARLALNNAAAQQHQACIQRPIHPSYGRVKQCGRVTGVNLSGRVIFF